MSEYRYVGISICWNNDAAPKTMKPFLSNKGDFHNKIILIENDEIISDNKEETQQFL